MAFEGQIPPADHLATLYRAILARLAHQAGGVTIIPPPTDDFLESKGCLWLKRLPDGSVEVTYEVQSPTAPS